MDNDERTKRLVKWARGGKAQPYFLELRVTDKCNLKCLYCTQKILTHRENELSQDELIELVEQAADMGVKSWDIVGDGEPLYNQKSCLALMQEIKKYGMQGAITTNGTLFTKESIRQIVDMGWEHITISLDAADAEIHNYVRGVGGSFNQLIRSVAYLNELKKEKDVDRPSVWFQVVIHRLNYRKLADIIQLAARSGCKAVSFQPLIVHFPSAEELKLSREDLSELQEEIKEVKMRAGQLGVETNIHEYENNTIINNSSNMQKVILKDEQEDKEKNKQKAEPDKNKFLELPCFEPWYMIAIRSDGRTGPCWHFNDENCENIREKSLEQIWNGEYFSKVRERIKNHKLFHYCSVCCAIGFIENKNIRGELAKYLK